MHYLGSPVLPLKFFENILKYYRYGLARVFIVEYQGKSIGTALALSFSRFMEVCWASTIQDYNHLSANMCLYWELIRFSIENNMSVFSFGRSSKESPTLVFKQQWGGHDLQLYWNYDLPINVDIRKMKFAAAIWKKLPAALVNRVGPIISSKIY
jgi:lipid II:glycine glycyltransferase (peptidoglycan interpeptide bridge formation enzyme)